MPGDLARFRTLTMGRPMIMGRRTWDSIARPLPGRESIVVTHSPIDLPPGAQRAANADAALDLAAAWAATQGADAIALIGGATLFAELLPRADRLHLTIMDLAPEADTFFPPLDLGAWREVDRQVPAPHPGDEASCTFVDYVRA